MKTKALSEPKQQNAFQNKYLAAVLAVAALFICAICSAQTDELKYSSINGYGFKYKRHAVDSVMLIPLSTSPHIPFRMGAIRYRASDSTLQLWTGYQWNSIVTGVGNGIDTAYAFDDSTLAIETPNQDYFIKIKGKPSATQLDDSTFVVGEDTITIRGTGGGSGGIASLNSLTGSSQTFATGTSGTDFGISSSSTTHTFNLPTASASNRGLLSSSDWSIFNGKQAAGNYITALTGDVTATGPGSVAATIAPNAVTNSKFRQSAANSVVGRSAASTGNVADIQASTNNTYLNYDGTIVKWDSIDYTHLRNKPDLQNPGVYFAPHTSFDPTFVVFASAIVYPNNSWSNGVPIDWQILDYTTSHNSSFYDSAGANTGNNRLKVFFPYVRNVLNTTITIDESFASRCLILGTTTALDFFEAPLYTIGTLGVRLTGAGTTTWTKNSGFSSLFNVDSYNSGAGLTRFDVPSSSGVFNFDPDALGIQYIGPNGYGIRRVYSGLGAYNVGFVLQDAFGNAVTTNPTTSDEILITNSGQSGIPVSAYLYNGTNTWFASNFNFWVFGAYECYLVAAPTSTTSTLVRWQTNYPSATNYKIYRSTTKYGTRTLIHTGTDGSYTDSGLSSSTLYYYHLVAVIGGVDTYITYFTTNTK